jgi:hypothetical protein
VLLLVKLVLINGTGHRENCYVISILKLSAESRIVCMMFWQHFFVCFSLYSFDLRMLDMPRNVHMDHVSAGLCELVIVVESSHLCFIKNHQKFTLCSSIDELLFVCSDGCGLFSNWS